MCSPEQCSPFWTAEEHHGPGCLCCCPEWGRAWPEPVMLRRFWTKEEKIKALEGYLEDLRKEAQAVEEELRKLREE